MNRFATLAAMVLMILLALLMAGDASARDIISLPNDAKSLELAPILERMEQKQPKLRVKTAPDGAGTSFEIIVDAKSKGPNFRWVIFSLRNFSQQRLEYQLMTHRRWFSGSGFYSPKSVSKPIVAISASTGPKPSLVEIDGGQVVAITLLPGQTITYVAEIKDKWPASLTLWKQSALSQFSEQESFLEGLLLGIAVLAAIYISTLFIVRRRLMFPIAALFAWSAVAFLCGEFGYLPSTFGVSAITDKVFRAASEAVMAFSLFGFLYSFLELRQHKPITGIGLLAIILASLITIGLSFYLPELATSTARIGILIAVLGGCLLILDMARRGLLRAHAIIPFWSLVTIWIFAVGAVVTNYWTHDLTVPVLVAGMAIVLLTLAFTVTQFAFTANLVSDGVYEDSGRKALALAGAEQCVWEWDENKKKLFVGREIEAMLGLKKGHIKNGGPEAWLQLVHPEDRASYLSVVDSSVQRGLGAFSLEFRMQRADGNYRWYFLRARIIPDEQGRALRCIGTLADVTSLKASEERMLRDAVHDYLTGLPNRALFLDRLERAILRKTPKQTNPLAVLVIDIDNFKSVNEGLGHAVGNGLLVEMARRLTSLVGSQDTVARLSGAQFGVISLSASDAREVATMAERIRRAMAAPVLISPREVHLTASIGVARHNTDEKTGAELLKDAEIALHHARRHGKDKIGFYRSNMRDERSARISLEADLRQALANKEIAIAYQPIVRMADMRVAGFEALLRWQHPRLGLLAPSDFIDLAEDTGLIIDIGRFVLERAARQLGTWQRAFTPSDPIFISINVSSRQLLTSALVEDLQFVMERADLVRGTLKLEITESLIMENPEQSVKVLRRLKELGASLSIDDFGTGYSSLSYLQRFPFDTIKIDQSFVRSGSPNSTTSIIMESIIALAGRLNMEVVAEGAETAQDVEMLKEAGCEYVQGFYFGQPMTAKEALDYFSSRTTKGEQIRKTESRIEQAEQAEDAEDIEELEEAQKTEETAPDADEQDSKPADDVDDNDKEETTQAAEILEAADDTASSPKIEPNTL